MAFLIIYLNFADNGDKNVDGHDDDDDDDLCFEKVISGKTHKYYMIIILLLYILVYGYTKEVFPV